MIELLCSVAGIVSGIALTASLYQYQANRAIYRAENPLSPSSERMGTIADRLQAITHGVAADVSAHSRKVGLSSDQLSLFEQDSSQEELLDSIHEIIRANQQMQGQLLEAQNKITVQSSMIEQASRQARTDALTGLGNRRALNEYVNNTLESLTEHDACGLLLMDIDKFKDFNDNYGHTTGDAVLSAFARTIIQAAGPTAYPARYGGEEFAVVIRGHSAQEVVERAAYIRHTVSQTPVKYDGMQLQVTSSAGLCMLLRGDQAGSAYDRADEGLYRSKESGRNCGHWLSGETWEFFPDVPETVDDTSESSGLNALRKPGMLTPPAVTAESIDEHVSRNRREGKTSEMQEEHDSNSVSQTVDEEHDKQPVRQPPEEIRKIYPNRQHEPEGSASDNSAHADDLTNDQPQQLESLVLESETSAADRALSDAGLEATHSPQKRDPRAEDPEEVPTPRTAASDAEAETPDFLEPDAFLQRLEGFLEQLRRADLPAAAITVEAVGLKETGEESADAGWHAVKELVQSNLRGIDLICSIRARSLCVFMPGCSREAATDRAERIHRSSAKLSSRLREDQCPEKLAISVVTPYANEPPEQFLQRLSDCCDQASHIDSSHIVVFGEEGSHEHEVAAT